jgi:hypothetical protein
MTTQSLEILLIEKCTTLNLKQKALDLLEEVFLAHVNNKDFLQGFKRSEIIPVFDRFAYQIERRSESPTIRTKIGLYVEDPAKVWIDHMEPIGYYELETDLDGQILDDWFVIEKGKYIKDIGIISHFQLINAKLPSAYLRRNHIQYEFVSYISLVGTLFVSKQFEGAGRFVQRAYMYLSGMDNNQLDAEYLRACKRFMKIMKDYLLENNLLSEDLRKELSEWT